MQIGRREDYPYLQSFLWTRFLPGSDESLALPDIIPDFLETAHPADVLGTRADIQRFVHDHGDDPDDAFARYLMDTLDPRGFGITTIDWLLEIDSLLAADGSRLA